MNVEPSLILEAAKTMLSQPDNDKFWRKDGLYSLDAMQRILKNDQVTPDDVDHALGDQPLRRPARAAKTEGVHGAITAVPLVSPANVEGDGGTTLAEIENQIAVDRQAVEDGLAKRDLAIAAAAKAVTETPEQQRARVVKEIQANTVAQLTARKEQNEKLAALGLRVFASPLDQALSTGGGRRSKVLRFDAATGKNEVFVAHDPRSQEGARNMAKHLHQKTQERLSHQQ